MSVELDQTISNVVEQDLREKLSAAVSESAERLRNELGETFQKAFSSERETAELASGRKTAEDLLAAVRRIRSEDSVTGVAAALVAGASRFAGRAALLIHKEDRLLGFRASGEADSEEAAKLSRLSFPISDAAAFAHAVSSLDVSVTRGRAEDLSPALVELFQLGELDPVSLFPVVLRDRALAVLYCDGSGGRPLLAPAVETLVAMSEAWIETIGTRRKPSSTAA